MTDEATKTYVLRANFMRYRRLTGYQPNGKPIWSSKRYDRGDEIELTDSEATRYLRSGAVVEPESFDADAIKKEETERRELFHATANVLPDETVPGSTPPPAAGEVTAEGIVVEDVDDLGDGSTGDEGGATGDTGEGGEASGDADGSQGQASPDIDAMSYPELQQHAKAVTGSGAGNADELRARLHEHYNQ